jgi:DNA-binding MarR family transcriptional regulator
MDELTPDQRSVFWSMRHGEVATQNLELHAEPFLEYAGKRRRHGWKMCELAHLILHHGYTSPEVVARAWGISKSRTNTNLRKLIAAGTLRELRYPTISTRLITLTSQGLAEARSLTGYEGPYTTNPNRIAHTLICHTIACQLSLLAHVAGRYGLHECDLYLVDTLIESRQWARSARPDVVIARGNSCALIEAELSRKNPARLREKISAGAALLADTDIRANQLLYYAPAGQVADLVSRELRKLSRSDSLVIKTRNRISIVTPDWLSTWK